MFSKILLPLDFSENSGKILPFALDMTQKFNAQLHLLYVARDLGYLGGLYVPHVSIESFSEEVQKGASKMMKEFYDEHFYSLQKTERHILVGDPADEILKFVSENQIDLVIMATHGRKGLERVISGSVAENVIRNSPVPVLIINPFKVEAGKYATEA